MAEYFVFKSDELYFQGNNIKEVEYRLLQIEPTLSPVIVYKVALGSIYAISLSHEREGYQCNKEHNYYGLYNPNSWVVKYGLYNTSKNSKYILILHATGEISRLLGSVDNLNDLLTRGAYSTLKGTGAFRIIDTNNLKMGYKSTMDSSKYIYDIDNKNISDESVYEKYKQDILDVTSRWIDIPNQYANPYAF